jgi:23S rRNA U2552 (ribose-2'-O)-methylase RlmE/FtsJ
MDIVIFKDGDILLDFFNGLRVFDQTVNYTKLQRYGNFEELDQTKAKIDLLDKHSERNRRAATKFLHEYELVKLICKKQVISRAYFKLYEIIYFNKLVYQPNLDCFFMCEAPGGFIECVSDIRRKKNLRTNYMTMSKDDHEIKYDTYLEKNNIIYGDITKIDIIEDTISKVLSRFPNKLDLITADGGFDVKIFNVQEIISTKLIMSEIFVAFSLQKIHGTFVIKFFDMSTHNSIMYYLLLCAVYENVKIIKPRTSRNCNSERYIVCENFKGIPKVFMDNLKLTIQQPEFVLFPDFNYHLLDPFNFEFRFKTFNNLIIHEQIKTINESIKMVKSKDTYFQNLLLKIFFDKISLNYILLFKNILMSRIRKCTDFLRFYNINTHQLVYRINE